MRVVPSLVTAVTLAALNLGPAALAADTHAHGHGAAPAKLQLDHGKKWATDAPLRRGMEAIREAVHGAPAPLHKATAKPRGLRRSRQARRGRGRAHRAGVQAAAGGGCAAAHRGCRTDRRRRRDEGREGCQGRPRRTRESGWRPEELREILRPPELDRRPRSSATQSMQQWGRVHEPDPNSSCCPSTESAYSTFPRCCPGRWRAWSLPRPARK